MIRKQIIVCVTLLLCLDVSAQEIPNNSMQYFNNTIESKGFFIDGIKEYINYDFTSVLQQDKYEYLGFIGDNY